MKITVAIQDLKDALSTSQATLGGANDITSHYLFSVEGERVDIMSTDLPRLFSKVSLTGAQVEWPEVEEPEETDEETEEDDEEAVNTAPFTVDGKRLMKAVSASSGVAVISYEDSQVTLSVEGGSLVFGSLDPESFPPWMDGFDAAKSKGGVKIPADALYDVLGGLKPYLSTDENRRPELCMLTWVDGIAYACDGFALGVARHESFAKLDGVKIHFKDISSMQKTLKSALGDEVEVLDLPKSTFLILPDGTLYGFMKLPHTYPSITQKYSGAFDYEPNRVWCFSKNTLSSALSFLGAGAADNDTTVNFTDDLTQALAEPLLEMDASSAGKKLTYTLSQEEIDTPLPEGGDLKKFDPSTVQHLGERMVVTYRVAAAKGEGKDDIPTFAFNSELKKRVIDTFSDRVYFGVELESAESNRGYLVYKQTTDSMVDIVSVVGWVS